MRQPATVRTARSHCAVGSLWYRTSVRENTSVQMVPALSSSMTRAARMIGAGKTGDASAAGAGAGTAIGMARTASSSHLILSMTCPPSRAV